MNQYALYTIYDTLHVPFWQKTVFYYTIMVVIFFVLVVIFLWYFKKRVVTVSSWDRALYELSQLKVNELLSDQDYKDRYFALSSIIKKYIYNRYAVDILSATDMECVDILQNNNLLCLQLLERLRSFFLSSALVKFSQVSFSKEQLLYDIALLSDVVSATIPDKQEKKSVHE